MPSTHNSDIGPSILFLRGSLTLSKVSSNLPADLSITEKVSVLTGFVMIQLLYDQSVQVNVWVPRLLVAILDIVIGNSIGE